MRITSLSLEHFRNYRSLDLALGAVGGVEVFVGPNAGGKTNILEAIGILSLHRSCRSAEERDIVSWDQSFYRIRGTMRSDEGIDHRLEVVMQFAPRVSRGFFLNDVRKQSSALIGFCPTVTFLPHEILLFSGSPSHRRRFLDDVLSQVSPAYLRAHQEYGKILRHRSALLRRIADALESPDALDPWDASLAKTGAIIVAERVQLLGAFALSIEREMAALGEPLCDVTLVMDRAGGGECDDASAEQFLRLLGAHRGRDIASCATTVGPHRDDWTMCAGGRSLSTFASRGQERTAVIALLLLQVGFLELKRGEKPIILLDDVFSELDDHHRSRLLSSLTEHQVIVTSTHLPPLTQSARVWQVVGGVVHAGSGAP